MYENLEQTRRSFIKTTGVALAGAAMVGLAGCAPQAANPSNDEAKAIDEITWDEEFDVIVVGAGVAGQSAAITVATEGSGESVLLIEKGDAPNGNSPYARGVSIWTNDEETFCGYLKELMSPYNMPSDEMLQAFSHGVAENRDWLISLGAGEGSYLFETQPGEVTTDGIGGEYPEIPGGEVIGWVGAGRETGVDETVETCHWMLEQVTTTFADKIDYRPKHALVGIVQDPSSRAVLGAIVENGSKQFYFKAAKGIVMALGGFESNPEMMQDYLGLGCAHPAAGFGNTGDGILICQKLGADLWHMGNAAGFWMLGRNLENTMSTDTPLVKDPTPKQFGITVGINGRRYYQDWDGYMCNPGYEQGGDLSTHVGYRHGHTQFGGEWPHLPFPEKSWFIFDQAGLEAGALDSEDPVAEGLAYKADNVEELASMIKVPADELVRTVANWNRYCENGFDEAFYRPAEFMTPVKEGPFYAQLVIPHFLNTDGGPRRSHKGEILDTDGNPIPGLYSAGEFGSIWGNYYQGAGNIAECMIFGRISARSILGK